MSIFEKIQATTQIAKSVFHIAKIQKDNNTLTAQSSILSRFPSDSVEFQQIQALNKMIHALIAEKDENWSIALKSWQETLNITDLELKYKALCQGAILELEYRS